MASGGMSPLRHTLAAHVKTLINQDLREICRQEGLPVSGIKNQLQTRVIDLINRYAQINDVEGLNRLSFRIYNHGRSPTTELGLPPSQTLASQPLAGINSFDLNTTPLAAPTAVHAMVNGFPRPPPPVPPPARPTVHGKTKKKARQDKQVSEMPTGLNFKPSPFFEIQEPVSRVLDLPTVHANRSSLTLPVQLESRHIDRLKNDNSMRVMLYSTSDYTFGSPVQAMDISFPQQLEVKVNGEEVKANFKGLKNKVGSTRPADITSFLRRQHPNTANTIHITYAYTHKKFTMTVNLVKKRSAEELTEQIKNRHVISKSTVIQEMMSKAKDPDIVATSSVMSLKDPVSYLRIQLPCRSNVCSHNQCFDATSFLQLQEQAPTWICPICSKTVAFESLAVDQYVQEILRDTPKSAEQVTIEPDGRWSYSNPTTTNGQMAGVKRKQQYDEDDFNDDLVEISDPRVKGLKGEGSSTPYYFANTPPMISRETSTPHSATNGTRAGQKRKSEIIDLTLSDDDEPSRPAKRQAYHTPISLPDTARNGYQLPNGSLYHAPSANHNSFHLGRPLLPQSSHSFPSTAVAPMGASISPSPLPPNNPLSSPALPNQYQLYRPQDLHMQQQSPSLAIPQHGNSTQRDFLLALAGRGPNAQ